jgi:hypothetical protein
MGRFGWRRSDARFAILLRSHESTHETHPDPVRDRRRRFALGLRRNAARRGEDGDKPCLKTTGSNICRAPGTGNMNQVESISGEDLRRSGGPITGARPGTTGN